MRQSAKSGKIMGFTEFARIFFTELFDASAKEAKLRKHMAKDTAKTARKQQLMHSITPRTNNDRSDQMPDDPISPSLTLPAR